MQSWPIHGKPLAAALLFASTALAQEVPRLPVFGTAPVAVSTTVEHRSRPSFETAPAVAASSRHWWYEDYPRSRETFPELHYLQPTAPSAEDDFCPVVMKWTLSGRHPVLPTVEVAGMDTWSPGMWRVPDPARQYGHFQSPGTRAALGAKIKHLVLEQLKY